METRSCEYGFILYWEKCGIFWFKGVTNLIIVLCKMGIHHALIFMDVLFVVTRKRREKEEKK